MNNQPFVNIGLGPFPLRWERRLVERLSRQRELRLEDEKRTQSGAIGPPVEHSDPLTSILSPAIFPSDSPQFSVPSEVLWNGTLGSVLRITTATISEGRGRIRLDISQDGSEFRPVAGTNRLLVTA